MDVEGGIHKYLVDSAWHLNLFLLSNINVTRAGAPHLTRLNTYQNNNIMDFSINENKFADKELRTDCLYNSKIC